MVCGPVLRFPFGGSALIRADLCIGIAGSDILGIPVLGRGPGLEVVAVVGTPAAIAPEKLQSTLVNLFFFVWIKVLVAPSGQRHRFGLQASCHLWGLDPAATTAQAAAIRRRPRWPVLAAFLLGVDPPGPTLLPAAWALAGRSRRFRLRLWLWLRGRSRRCAEVETKLPRGHLHPGPCVQALHTLLKRPQAQLCNSHRPASSLPPFWPELLICSFVRKCYSAQVLQLVEG